MKMITACIFGLTLISNIAFATAPARVVGDCWTDCNGRPTNSPKYFVHIDAESMSKGDLLQLLDKFNSVSYVNWRYPHFMSQSGSDTPGTFISIMGSLYNYVEEDLAKGRVPRDPIKSEVETKINKLLLNNEVLYINCDEDCFVTPPEPSTR